MSNTHRYVNRYVREQRADPCGEQMLYSAHSAHSSHRRVFETGDSWMIRQSNTSLQDMASALFYESLPGDPNMAGVGDAEYLGGGV